MAENKELQNLPSVNEVLAHPDVAELAGKHGRAVVKHATQQAIGRARTAVLDGGEAPDDDAICGESLRPVINATGVVGRVHPRVICGARMSRDTHADERSLSVARHCVGLFGEEGRLKCQLPGWCSALKPCQLVEKVRDRVDKVRLEEVHGLSLRSIAFGTVHQPFMGYDSPDLLDSVSGKTVGTVRAYTTWHRSSQCRAYLALRLGSHMTAEAWSPRMEPRWWMYLAVNGEPFGRIEYEPPASGFWKMPAIGKWKSFIGDTLFGTVSPPTNRTTNTPIWIERPAPCPRLPIALAPEGATPLSVARGLWRILRSAIRGDDLPYEDLVIPRRFGEIGGLTDDELACWFLANIIFRSIYLPQPEDRD